MSYRDRYNAFIERHDVAWELLFAFLAIVFVAISIPIDTAPPEYQTPLLVLDVSLTLIFLAEFSTRLWASRDRKAYLRGHWIDAVAIIPAVRSVPALRLLRLLRLVRAFAGVGRAFGHVDRLANHRGLVWMLVAWSAVMVGSSIALYAAENGVNKAITSPFDALWWGIVTLSTVGYGDVYPITPEGRLAAATLMVLGIGLYGVIIATITSYFMSPASPATEADPTKICPDCAETVKAEARICRYCRYEFAPTIES